MYEFSMETMGAVRAPIQCEGIERGPQRIAEVANLGAVDPQFSWSSVLDTVGKVAKVAVPAIASAL